MPQTFSSREELKRDLLQEKVKLVLEWIAGHRQTFYSIVGTAAIAAVAVVFIVANFRSLRKQAWEKYSMGQNWLYSNNPDNALNSFNDVITNYGQTPAAVYSLLSKGDLFYQQKKYPEAAEAYKQALDKSPAKLVVPFVLSGLGAAQEDGGDYPAAIETYKRFLSEFPDHYLTPKVYESLARTHELALNPDAAKAVYEKIITMFPSTLWSEKARLRYQKLAPQPFQSGQVPNLQQNPNPSVR